MSALSSLVFAALVATLSFQCAADIEVYFGCGCYWHVQYAFVRLEQRLLHRTGAQVTARTAYGGSKQLGPGGLVCYHNYQQMADYAELGQAEAVTVSVPEAHFDAFVSTFWELCPGGNRKDIGDSDHQYRSVIGLPGGLSSPLAAKFRNNPHAAQLQAGVGGDPDTFGKNIVWVYDTNTFPATTAEKYQQFHDDFMRGPYDQQYHSLQRFEAVTRCPGDAVVLSDLFAMIPSRHTFLSGLYMPSIAWCIVSLSGVTVVWLLAKHLPSENRAEAYMPI